MHDFPFRHEHELGDDDFKGCCKHCAAGARIIKDHLLRFHAAISALSDAELATMPIPELYQLFLLLDDIAHLNGADSMTNMVLGDEDVQRVLPDVRRYYTRFFDLHETALAESILASPKPWTVLKRYTLFPRYRSLVRSQASLTGADECERLAFIGCGPVPLTLILLEQEYGMSCLGIDRNPEAAAMAEKVIARLDVPNISIRCGDESCLEQGDCDLVLVAALAEPKRSIFERLAGMPASRRVPVMYRTYSGLRTLLHEPTPPDPVPGFVETARIQPTGRVNNTLVRLEPS